MIILFLASTMMLHAQTRQRNSVNNANASPPSMPLFELKIEPYRKIDGKYYDLRPLYAWLTNYAWFTNAGSRARGHPRPANPMPDWYAPSPGWARDYVLEYRTLQVLNDGLLAREIHWNYLNHGIIAEGNPFFLKNYPNFHNLIDNEEIHFIALRNGNYRYTDVMGAIRTVPSYDYGIPVSFEEIRAFP